MTLTDNAGHLICCFDNKTSNFTVFQYGIDVEHAVMTKEIISLNKIS